MKEGGWGYYPSGGLGLLLLIVLVLAFSGRRGALKGWESDSVREVLKPCDQPKRSGSVEGLSGEELAKIEELFTRAKTW